MSYDVAVIGGGRAGAAAAAKLTAGGCRTLLVDRPGRRRLGESLVPAARTLLDELGVWDRFRRDGHLPCHGNESLWGAAEAHRTDFIRSPHGHGWHLDGRRLDELLRAAAASAGATVWTGTGLAGLESVRGGWRLSLAGSDGPRNARAGYVLDASGRGHHVARRLGIGRHYGDRLVAFQALFRAASADGDDPDRLNLVEAVPEGWWYTARVPCLEGSSRVAVLFTDAGSPWLGRAASREGFLDLLAGARAVCDRLAGHGYALATGPVAADARSSRLERLHGEGWLAIGDAAIAFDPLSSQGIFTALYGGVRAARAVLARLGGDAAAPRQLEDELLAVYDRYQINRDRFYRQERRWPRSRFWAARLADRTPPP